MQGSRIQGEVVLFSVQAYIPIGLLQMEEEGIEEKRRLFPVVCVSQSGVLAGDE
jgi:hypothetical protein